MNLRQNVTPMTCLVFLLWWFLRIGIVLLAIVLGNRTGQIWVLVVTVAVGFTSVQFLIRRMDVWQLKNRKIKKMTP